MFLKNYYKNRGNVYEYIHVTLRCTGVTTVVVVNINNSLPECVSVALDMQYAMFMFRIAVCDHKVTIGVLFLSKVYLNLLFSDKFIRIKFMEFRMYICHLHNYHAHHVSTYLLTYLLHDAESFLRS